jgi:16S rRNA (guanine966-N2)-methyltransferase
MRIISGTLKGKKIFFEKNISTRPLRDMVKENIFNIIEHSKLINFNIQKIKVLDLFAGYGSFGLECLSRDADEVIFVENNLKSFELLKKNINFLSLSGRCKAIRSDARNFICSEMKKYDLIFLDPPYKEKKIVNEIILMIKKNKILKKNNLLILHRENEQDSLNENYDLIDKRRYGRSYIYFYRIN